MKKRLLLLLVLFTAFLQITTAQISTFTGTGDWSTPERWSGGIVPTSTYGTVINGTCTISTAIVIAGSGFITINVTGSSLTISNTGSLTLNGTSQLTIDNGTMSNAGTLTLSAGTFMIINSKTVNALSNSGTINNSGKIYITSEFVNNIFTNTGTINNNSGGFIGGIGTISSTSITNPSGGIVGGFYDDSSLHDCLTFSNNLINNGIIKFSMVSAGTACTTYNTIAVGNAMTFGGTFTASGTATSGTYTLMTYGSRIGTFTNTTAPLGNGKHLNIRATDYGANILTGTIEDSPVLGVELSKFNATTEGAKNYLSWSTASENNNKGFQVERRQSIGDSWDILGFKTANNKSSTYEFTDNTPLSTSYYRLRQLDNDGKETLSKVISVANKGNNKLKVYPNPVLNTLTVERNAVPLDTNDFQIYNLLGQQVMNGKATQRIDVSALPQGTYFLKVGAEQVKFIKQE